MKNTAIWYRSFGDPLKHLSLETYSMGKLSAGHLRVEVLLAPVNASDLIPVTGAYAHRIKLPVIAGYEGVGKVIDAPLWSRHLIGKRVLPLRGAGTWQRYIDCTPAYLIPVPDDISDIDAARSYINPLTVLFLLRNWPVVGKRILVTGAGSTCANFLGNWALRYGAKMVTGIYRSSARIPSIKKSGMIPVSLHDDRAVRNCAAHADLTFDVLGGERLVL